MHVVCLAKLNNITGQLPANISFLFHFTQINVLFSFFVFVVGDHLNTSNKWIDHLLEMIILVQRNRISNWKQYLTVYIQILIIIINGQTVSNELKLIYYSPSPRTRILPLIHLDKKKEE